MHADDQLRVENRAQVAERVVTQCRKIARDRWGLDVTHWTPEVWLSRLFARVRFAHTDGGSLVFKIVAYDSDTGEISQVVWELN